MPLAAGSRFAGFTIERLLGFGRRCEVYLAQHPRLPRRDAVKVLPSEFSDDPDYRARFEREADLASTLWHPHIVGVHDRGEADGKFVDRMDFFDGLDTGRLLAQRYSTGMPANLVIRMVQSAATAAGAVVIGPASSDQGATALTELGADRAINLRSHDVTEAVLDITSGRGVDLMVDLVGVNGFR
jgi:serine/threonine protein kinase